MGFSNIGWAFLYWNTESDFSSTTYWNNEQVVNLSDINEDVINLYARWVDNKLTLTVSFDEITDGTPQISGNITVSRSGSGGNVTHEVLITNPGLYDSGSIQWEIAGVGAFSGTTVTGSGDSFIIDASNIIYNSLGNHILKLDVQINGTLYRKNINFTIVN